MLPSTNLTILYIYMYVRNWNYNIDRWHIRRLLLEQFHSGRQLLIAFMKECNVTTSVCLSISIYWIKYVLDIAVNIYYCIHYLGQYYFVTGITYPRIDCN